MVVIEPVQRAIWHALNHYNYADALFLAEKLYAELGTDDSLFLLATCFYRCGKPTRAYTLLKNKGCPTAQCKYLMARCCLELNKLSEAELMLGGNILTRSKNVEDFINDYGDAACYALALLANIYSKTDRQAKAAEFYNKSLKLNPFMWSSFEKMCHIGEKPDAAKIFQVGNSSQVSILASNSNPMATSGTPVGHPLIQVTQESPAQDCTPPQVGSHIIYETPENLTSVDPVLVPSAPVTQKIIRNKTKAGRSILGGAPSLSPMTPSFGILPLDTPTPGNSQNTSPYITPSPMSGCQPSDHPRAPTKRLVSLRNPSESNKPPVFSQSGNTNAQTPSPQAGLQNSQNVPHLRRSSRLFTNANSNSVKENNKSQARGKFASPKGPAKRSKSKTTKTQELNEINKTEKEPDAKTPTQTLQQQSAAGLMSLLQDLGKAYLALSQYECKKAIDLLSDLPIHQYQTGWVLSQIGRAYFELAEYQKAEKVFEKMWRTAPHHFEGLEFHSTTLWHLQKDVQLSKLAQEATELDKDAPQAWCAAGNCFSLQREHDTAIKFFQRAVQVDPNFAYAYTLLGHEYVLTEEFDKAMACFRNAIRVDPRHYNAWYGVGMIFYKQEKFGLAEVHFRKALTINPQSSVLLCHIGVVQHALQKSDNALITLNKAIAADPKNPLCKFHRASILFASERHKEALTELEELKEIVPKESLVYFLIGKVHKKLGNTHLALMNFSWAMDLDPKGANNQIKEAIDKRYVTEEEFGEGEAGPGLDITGPDAQSSQQDLSMDTEDMQLQAVESDESL